jgi:hypothetical protein
VLKRMPRWHLAAFTIYSIVIAAPLIYLTVRYPRFGLQLFGAPDTWPPDLWQNLKILVQQYVNFMHPQSGVLMTPVLGLGSIALVLIGAWQLYTIRYTARSYTLSAWIILLVPVLLINPMFTSVTFVPLLLLLASGLAYLLRYWYRMFPKNPYARFVGLVPLSVLVLGLVVTGTDRYFEGYRYDPVTATSFNHDVSLYNDEVNRKGISKLVVAKSELPFYRALVRYDHKSPTLVLTTTPSSGHFAATKAAHVSIQGSNVIRIVTTAVSQDSDRFYLYKK